MQKQGLYGLGVHPGHGIGRLDRLQRREVIRPEALGPAQHTDKLAPGSKHPGDTLMHLARESCWVGYGPALLAKPRMMAAISRFPALFASFPRTKIEPTLESRPGKWHSFSAVIGEHGELSALIATDLLIQDWAARCAAQLLRFGQLPFRQPQAAAMAG